MEERGLEDIPSKRVFFFEGLGIRGKIPCCAGKVCSYSEYDSPYIMAWHLGVKVCRLRLEGCMSHGNWVFWQKHMPTLCCGSHDELWRCRDGACWPIKLRNEEEHLSAIIYYFFIFCCFSRL